MFLKQVAPADVGTFIDQLEPPYPLLSFDRRLHRRTTPFDVTARGCGGVPVRRGIPPPCIAETWGDALGRGVLPPKPIHSGGGSEPLMTRRSTASSLGGIEYADQLSG
jgi:hypothetical protein